ncbi:MAG: hypothetical protein AB8B55_20605 [Mariniblastus sp.]
MSNRPNLRLAFCLAISTFVTAVAIVETASATDQLTSGSSSKTLRKQTANSIPYNQLNQQTKDKIGDILAKPSIYRRLPVTSINADPDYFRFLVRYPEVIVNIWQLMGVTQMTTERTGPFTISTNDGAGTISQLELVYGTENMHIFYGTGTYEGSVLKRKLTGKCVLVLRSDNRVGADGKPTATSQLDVFLKVENATAGLIAKTIAPLVGSTADHNFVESLRFVERLNKTTENNGPGVQQMGTRLKIDQGVRQKFNQVIDVVFQRAIKASAPSDGRMQVETSAQRSANSANRPSQYAAPTQPSRTLNRQDYLRQGYKTPNQFQKPRTQQSPNATGYEKLDFGQNRPSPNRNLLNVYDRQMQFGARQPVPMPQRIPARGHQAPVYQQPRYDNRVQPASWYPQSSPQWHR